jgi:hypothetical protein
MADGGPTVGGFINAGEWMRRNLTFVPADVPESIFPPRKKRKFRRADEDIRREHESRIATESLSAIHEGFGKMSICDCGRWSGSSTYN